MKENTWPHTQSRHIFEAAALQAAEVNDALALLLTLLDAAHDQTVSIDQVRCLLEPLQRKLSVALERMGECR